MTREEPKTICSQVPQENCQNVPKEVCAPIQRNICDIVPVEKEVQNCQFLPKYVVLCMYLLWITHPTRQLGTLSKRDGVIC